MFDNDNKLKALTGKDEKNETVYRLKQYTNSVPNFYNNPGKHVHAHMDFLKENFPEQFKYRWGQTFELLFIDALVHFTNNRDESIKIDSLLLNKKSVEDYPIWKASKVDVDIRLNNLKLFFLKTSARERRKQIERDAMAPMMSGFDKYYIHYKEYKHSKPTDALNQAIKIRESLITDIEVLTVYDEQGIYNLFNSFVN